jgi:very-short-patch-repair endonuclease
MEWIAFNEIETAEVKTQVDIGPYRADILISEAGRKLVVECDGAEFHAISKEQVERDKRRDRYCAAQGICVMRFCGSEINRDPRGCAAEIGRWIKLR